MQDFAKHIDRLLDGHERDQLVGLIRKIAGSL
jgi:hypothetical protein